MIKLYKMNEVPKTEIFARESATANVSGIVSEIVENVKKRGDSAIYEYAEKFDGVRLSTLRVSEEEIDEAFSLVEDKFVEILRKAAENIRSFHEKQVREGFCVKKENGVITGQKITPIEKVGLYVPGGTAAYPSTVLMDSIPAKIAGCKRVVMVTPPKKDGKVSAVILAAAKIAGIDEIYKVGGAQAVAALAYGTESIASVDKIVGPGNAFVAEAKKQVFGKVAIDMIAGPSEILIVADGTCNPKFVAADLLSQAEHDKNASAVLVTDSERLALAVSEELERQIPTLPRAEIARASIDKNGKIIVVETLDEAIAVSNELAPEHLELCMDDPFPYLEKVENAGSVFMGKHCPEALGDYYAGPNHTLPTGGTARFSNPLGVDDFVKKTQYTYYTSEALCEVGADVAYFANKEGLDAHANSVLVRIEK